MSESPLLKRMLDAGMQFTEMSQKQAEKLVKEFVKVGQARRKDTDEMVRQLVERGRGLSEQIVATVQAELSKQLGKLAGRLDDVEARLEAVAARVGIAKPPTPAANPDAEGAKKSTQKVDSQSD